VINTKWLVMPLFLLMSTAFGQTFNEFITKLAQAENNTEKLVILQDAKQVIDSFSFYQQAEFWHRLGRLQPSANQLKKSVESYSKGIEIYEKHQLPESPLLVNLLIDRARSAVRLDILKFQIGCEDLTQAIQLSRKIGNQALIAKSLAVNARCIYRKNNETKLSLELLNEAFAISQKQQLPDETLSLLYNQAAILYARFALYDKAYEYNLLSYQVYLESNNYVNMYTALGNLISNCITSGKFERAQSHLEQLYQFSLQHPELKDVQLKYYFFSARVAQEQKKWLKSIDLLKKAILEVGNTEQETYIQATYERLSFSYFRQGDIKNSQKYFTLANQLYPNKPLVVKELKSIKTLVEHKSLDALNNAFDLLNNERSKKYQFIKKSTASLAHTYDANLKQLNNVLLQQRLTYMAIAAAVVILILATIAYIQFQRRKLAKKESILMEELLSTKNQLLADVSHELRTPLTVLQIEIETLQHDFSDDVQASYKALRKKITDMNYLIDDISELAKSDVGALKFDFSPQNIKALVDKSAEELARFIIAKGFNWQCHITLEDSLILTIDKAKIKQLMVNLISNSVKYTSPGGQIALSISQSTSCVRIKVSDSAPSVSSDKLGKIFERLYRVESSRNRATGGSGLGLAICKSIVEAHQGKIFARQSDLGGLEVVIELPIN